MVERLQLDENGKHEDVHTIISKSIFLYKNFPESTIFSDFDLVRGYAPSILGSVPMNFTDYMLRVQNQSVAIRALHRLLRSQNPKVIDRTAINTVE